MTGQLIEGRGSARIAKSTRRGRPGFGREGPRTQEQVACTQRATLPVTILPTIHSNDIIASDGEVSELSSR